MQLEKRQWKYVPKESETLFYQEQRLLGYYGELQLFSKYLRRLLSHYATSFLVPVSLFLGGGESREGELQACTCKCMSRVLSPYATSSAQFTGSGRLCNKLSTRLSSQRSSRLLQQSTEVEAYYVLPF